MHQSTAHLEMASLGKGNLNHQICYFSLKLISWKRDNAKKTGQLSVLSELEILIYHSHTS